MGWQALHCAYKTEYDLLLGWKRCTVLRSEISCRCLGFEAARH